LNVAAESAILSEKRKLMVFSTARRRPGRFAAHARLLLLAPLLVLRPGNAAAATYSVPRFSDTAIVQGLSAVTDFAFLPDGRILLLEKAGRVLAAGPGGGAPTVVLDFRNSVEDTGERGLLGICLHPTFASTGWIYLYYTTNVPMNRIARFTLIGSTINPASQSVVLDNIEITPPASNHNGGTVLIGPDGKLWAAPGDSGTGGAKAQDVAAASSSRFNGKVLRMELDGSPAAGNPFLGDASKEPRIWAYGFRNPFRFSFRPSNGSIYIGDVGQSTREELDVGVAGGNFGWPYMEGAIQQPDGPGACPPTTTCLPPVFDYVRSVGTTITGGAFVTGNAYPPFLQNRYVFGDYGADWIRYLEFDSNNALVGGLQDLATAAEGPVAFHQGPDGYLYYAAINSGKIYRINYGKNFHTVVPCRVFDTRNPAGPGGGPRLDAGADRTFMVGGRCGVPATARAVSVNVTVTEPTDFGFLTLFPVGGAVPLASTINFRPGQTRANNAAVTLGAAGDLVVRAGMASGGVHVLLDVTGYFDD
jgi:glucose/arabinose dehydrogenase